VGPPTGAYPVAVDNPVALVPIWVEIIAAVIGGIVGALMAARERFDINGALIAAIVTGLGGGMIRDVLSGDVPVALTSPWLLAAATVAGLLTFVFSRQVDFVHGKAKPLLTILDAVFLAQYTVMGVARAMNHDLPFLSCVFLGVITGVGGGVLRDMVLGRTPDVLRPGTLEAGASVVGAVIQTAVALLAAPIVGFFTGLVVIITVRLLSVWLHWETPPARIAARDQPPK